MTRLNWVPDEEAEAAFGVFTVAVDEPVAAISIDVEGVAPPLSPPLPPAPSPAALPAPDAVAGTAILAVLTTAADGADLMVPEEEAGATEEAVACSSLCMLEMLSLRSERMRTLDLVPIFCLVTNSSAIAVKSTSGVQYTILVVVVVGWYTLY